MTDIHGQTSIPDPKVLTVSREALRADLAEMELSLRIWIGDELDKKANSSDFSVLRSEIKLTADAVTASREGAAKALSEALGTQHHANEARFAKIEGALAKMLGGLALLGFIFPALTAILLFILTSKK